MVKVGERAPQFTLTTHEGKSLSLANLRGRKVLLWFYLEADTPACTTEGCGLRGHQEYFDQCNIQVLGVSFDSVERNAIFADRQSFGFLLLSDLDHSVAVAYGACANPKARHPERISFLIDEDGNLARVYDQVDPRDHAARVLADILGV